MQRHGPERRDEAPRPRERDGVGHRGDLRDHPVQVERALQRDVRRKRGGQALRAARGHRPGSAAPKRRAGGARPAPLHAGERATRWRARSARRRRAAASRVVKAGASSDASAAEGVDEPHDDSPAGASTTSRTIVSHADGESYCAARPARGRTSTWLLNVPKSTDRALARARAATSRSVRRPTQAGATGEQQVQVEDVARLRLPPPGQRPDLLPEGRRGVVVADHERREPIPAGDDRVDAAEHHAVLQAAARALDLRRQGSAAPCDAEPDLPALGRLGLLRLRHPIDGDAPSLEDLGERAGREKLLTLSLNGSLSDLAEIEAHVLRVPDAPVEEAEVAAALQHEEPASRAARAGRGRGGGTARRTRWERWRPRRPPVY